MATGRSCAKLRMQCRKFTGGSPPFALLAAPLQAAVVCWHQAGLLLDDGRKPVGGCLGRKPGHVQQGARHPQRVFTCAGHHFLHSAERDGQQVRQCCDDGHAVAHTRWRVAQVGVARNCGCRVGQRVEQVRHCHPSALRVYPSTCAQKPCFRPCFCRSASMNWLWDGCAP